MKKLSLTIALLGLLLTLFLYQKNTFLLISLTIFSYGIMSFLATIYSSDNDGLFFLFSLIPSLLFSYPLLLLFDQKEFLVLFLLIIWALFLFVYLKVRKEVKNREPSIDYEEVMKKYDK